MRSHHRRRVPTALVVLATFALVLSACSNPAGPEAALDDLVTFELDGFTAQVELSKIDPEALTPQAFPTTTAGDAGQNVEYYLVPVPMLTIVGKRLVTYVDVFCSTSSSRAC